MGPLRSVPTDEPPVDRAEAKPLDDELIDRVLAGDEAAFELVMRRHNQLLFRTARSIVASDWDAEDVVQEAYLKAFRSLGGFERRSSLATWLVRITVHEALTRTARAQRVGALAAVSAREGEVADDAAVRATGWLGDRRRRPEDAAADAELRALLARAVERLPESLRIVFVLREVEGLGVAEIADGLELSAEAVRVRVHRARVALQADIDASVTRETRRLYSFGHERCDRLVTHVLEQLRTGDERR